MIKRTLGNIEFIVSKSIDNLKHAEKVFDQDNDQISKESEDLRTWLKETKQKSTSHQKISKMRDAIRNK